MVAQLVEQRDRRRGIARDELACKLEANGGRDQILLNTVVKGPFVRTSRGEGGPDDASCIHNA